LTFLEAIVAAVVVDVDIVLVIIVVVIVFSVNVISLLWPGLCLQITRYLDVVNKCSSEVPKLKATIEFVLLLLWRCMLLLNTL